MGLLLARSRQIGGARKDIPFLPPVEENTKFGCEEEEQERLVAIVAQQQTGCSREYRGRPAVLHGEQQGKIFETDSQSEHAMIIHFASPTSRTQIIFIYFLRHTSIFAMNLFRCFTGAPN